MLIVLWIWALQDCLKRKPEDFPGGANDKIVWTLMLLFTLFLGAILYVFLVQGRSRTT